MLFKFLIFFMGLFSFNAFALDVVIKSTTNRDDFNVGDYWIGEDLAEGFRQLRKEVDIDYRGEYHKVRKSEPEFNIFMRGYTKFTPPFPKGTNVLYCYYPMAFWKTSKQKKIKDILNTQPQMPENSSLDDDWQNYDVVTVASKTYAAKLKDIGINAVYVPQFTNPQKFYPDPNDTLKQDILFVGSNWHDRTSLRYAIESGFTVAVYGYNWQGVIPQDMYKSQYIENKDLNKYYSSAKIVLNDHRPDMKAFGFINNRIYDATAAGALVISDYMPEIEEIYGDSVPMYKTKEELSYLLNYYLVHDKERVTLAKKAREITLKNFTNTIIAKKISDVIAGVSQ